MRIRVAIRDKVGKDFRIVELKRIKTMADVDLRRIAKTCERIIQETIMRKTKMPTGNLASNFLASPILGGWGVGDIVTLDKNAPYWNHIDKGSEGIGANWDHFLPKGFWANGRWVESSNGFSGIQPKTPIEAVNYIISTIAQMEIIIPSILKGI